MGSPCSPIVSSLREALQQMGVKAENLPDPDRLPLVDALRRIVHLARQTGNPSAENRATMAGAYVGTLERAYRSDAAPDHPRRGMR